MVGKEVVEVSSHVRLGFWDVFSLYIRRWCCRGVLISIAVIRRIYCMAILTQFDENILIPALK